MSRRRQHGLSLIELLVAIAIIAAMYGAIVLSANTAGGSRAVEREGTRLAALIEVACERATLSGRDIGIHFGLARYGFSFNSPAGWRIETGDSDLRPRDLAAGLAMEVRREGAPLELQEALPEEPQAACFPSGELTPFSAVVYTGGDIAPFELDAAIDGVVEGGLVERRL